MPKLAEVVPDDPLALQRAGWAFLQRDDAPFEHDTDSLPVACDEAAPLEAFNGVDRVVDDFELDSVRLSVSIVDVGSLGNQLADGVLGLEPCLARAFEEVDTVALSSIRATWLQVGQELALATIVGEANRAILLELEGGPFGEDLVANLAHRADQYLRGVDVVGTPSATTTSVGPDGRFVDVGADRVRAIGQVDRDAVAAASPAFAHDCCRRGPAQLLRQRSVQP